MGSSVVAVVGLGRIGALVAQQLHDQRLLGIDRDRVEAGNGYPPFVGCAPGTPKARIVESLMRDRFGHPDRRLFVEGFFPDDVSASLLRRVRVLVIAADTLRDRHVIELAGRACGARVVNVAGWGDVGQLTVYGRGPEAACMECELGPGYSLALPMATTSAPGCAPAPETSQLLARVAARTVRRLFRGEDPGGVADLFLHGRRRESLRITRSPGCASPAHRSVEWRRVRARVGATVGQVLEAAGLPSATLLSPVFARPDCPGCGAVVGHPYRREGSVCPHCDAVRPLTWEIGADGPLSDRPLASLGLPDPASFRSADGSVWVEVVAGRTEPDPLLAWMDGDVGSETPGLEARNGR